MAPLNNKYALILYIGVILLLLFIGGYYLLFRKQKDYYVIKEVEVKPVQLIGDSLRGYKIVPFNAAINKNVRWGISVKLRKKYISKAHSKRYLLGGSMEPGINGIAIKINTFKVSLMEHGAIVNLSDSLYSSNSINQIKGITLARFIEDINNNKKYTRGTKLDNRETYFWSKLPSQNILQTLDSKLLLEVQITGSCIKKSLLENNTQ